MNENIKFGFIGIGNMANALISGILNNNIASQNIIIYDINEEKTKAFTDIGVVKASNITMLSELADVIFFTIKPQTFDEVISKVVSNSNKLYVSIAAGISIKYLEQNLGDTMQIVRVMPNTPLLIGLGATAISYSTNVNTISKKVVEGIFTSLGTASVLPENKMNEIIAVNGSSPGYIYYFADLVIKKAVSMGIEENVAKNLFCNTLIGSAQMMLNSKEPTSELINKVTSKGGTTIKALEVFYKSDFEEIINSAIDECTKRAYELDKA